MRNRSCVRRKLKLPGVDPGGWHFAVGNSTACAGAIASAGGGQGVAVDFKVKTCVAGGGVFFVVVDKGFEDTGDWRAPWSSVRTAPRTAPCHLARVAIIFVLLQLGNFTFGAFEQFENKLGGELPAVEFCAALPTCRARFPGPVSRFAATARALHGVEVVRPRARHLLAKTRAADSCTKPGKFLGMA